jgi:BlaI family transcriptional regulator, penicillinase repressor
MEKINYSPSDAELEILQIIWEVKEARVKDIFEKLNQLREVGYTTILKTMQIMHEKGVLEREADGKSHIYRALVEKKDIQEKFLDKILNKVYHGSAYNLVMSALGNYTASEKELEQIKNFIKQQELKAKK